MIRFLLYSLLLVALIGCTAPKKLNRKLGYFEPKNSSGETIVNTNGGSTDSFSGRLNLLYEKKIRGAINSPIYAGDDFIGFLTTRNRFLFFDPETGKRICRVKKGKGYILNPVVTDSLIVLVRKIPLGEIRVRNLFTNKTIQERTVNQIRSGPILCNNSLAIGTTTGIELLSLPELRTEWTFDVKTIIDLTPQTDGETVYFAGGGGLVGAVNASDGGLVWKQELKRDIVSEMTLGTYLYLGLDDGAVLALDVRTGREVWETQLECEVHGQFSEANGLLYFGGTDTKVYALSVNTGEIVWSFATAGIVTAPPITFGNSVIVGSYDRHLYSLDRETGQLLDKQLLEGPVNFAAMVHKNKILVACRKNRLYCFEGN
ncbi:MAG: PQQ-binding-like beta-propeller repeat protein [Candidatus Zixiibacteriota bacterium]